MDNIIVYEVKQEHSDMVIRKYLKDIVGLSRRFIKSAGRSERIKVNDKIVWLDYVVKNGDIIKINVQKDESQNIDPENMHLDIVYEDSYITVVNKKPGIVAHPTKSHPSGTLSNGLIYHYRQNGDTSIVRLVNRLDMNTSGLVIAAKNQFAHMALSFEMNKNNIVKEYLAITHGKMEENKGTINLPIGRPSEDSIKRWVIDEGQQSITHYETIESYDEGELLKLRLETGRTHQIRVHLSYLGSPIYGDSLYGKIEDEYIERQALHAYKLKFPHPKTGEMICLEADIPEDMKQLISKLK